MAEHEAVVLLMDETLDMMIFADDIVLLSSKWNLQINEAKTTVSMFGTNYTYQFHCNSLPLEVVEEYKYLGLWISKKKKFQKSHTSC